MDTSSHLGMAIRATVLRLECWEGELLNIRIPEDGRIRAPMAGDFTLPQGFIALTALTASP